MVRDFASEPVAIRKFGEPAIDPVLAALIARLPPGGSIWPARKRAAWMQMLWLAFDLVYEDDGEAAELPAFLQGIGQPSAIAAAAPTARASPYAFYIDKEGYARRGDGGRIAPPEVGGVIFDLRGEGDLGAIIWADDTRGVPGGLQLDISPAF